MLSSLEEARRRQPDVCRYCGWGRVRTEFRWECVNPHCLEPARTPYTEPWSDTFDPFFDER